ncbi:MAG: hypothetical protein ACJ0GR_03495 [Prochlorococcaceae cyanobacterium]
MPKLPMQLPPSKLMLRVVRVLIWLLAFSFLIAEGKEYLKLRQLTHVAVFTLLFFLANYQLNVARFAKDQLIAARSKLASTLMFLASMFSIIETGIDQVIASYCTTADGSSIQLSPTAISLCSLVWLAGVVMVILAVASFEEFLPTLNSDWLQLEKARATPPS